MNLPRCLHRFLEPVLEPSSVGFSVFYEESRIFLGIPNFCRYSSIFLDFLGLFGLRETAPVLTSDMGGLDSVGPSTLIFSAIKG